MVSCTCSFKAFQSNLLLVRLVGQIPISVALKSWLFVGCYHHLIVIWRNIKLGIAAIWHQILAHVLLDGDDGCRMPLWCNEHPPVIETYERPQLNRSITWEMWPKKPLGSTFWLISLIRNVEERTSEFNKVHPAKFECVWCTAHRGILRLSFPSSGWFEGPWQQPNQRSMLICPRQMFWQDTRFLGRSVLIILNLCSQITVRLRLKICRHEGYEDPLISWACVIFHPISYNMVVLWISCVILWLIYGWSWQCQCANPNWV